MSRSETAYGAYGGVELRLANDVVHMVDDLTVAEALRFLRVFEGAAEDLRILYLFLREFIPRLGLGALVGVEGDELTTRPDHRRAVDQEEEELPGHLARGRPAVDGRVFLHHVVDTSVELALVGRPWRIIT